jgi:tRNA modification GTPase
MGTNAKEAGEHRKILESDLLLRGGIRLVIAGRTNAGKSSLFNRLAGQERVLVSHEHGTTRDVVSERIVLEGTTVILFDTAGFRTGADGIVAEAVERSERAIRDADIVIFVMDGSSPAGREDEVLIDFLRKGGKRFITAVNKIDLPRRLEAGPFEGNAGLTEISAKDGWNIEGVTGLVRKELALPESEGKSAFCATERTVKLFQRLERSFGVIAERLKARTAYDSVVLEIRGAMEALDEASGFSADPDILDRIFSRFCVGK